MVGVPNTVNDPKLVMSPEGKGKLKKNDEGTVLKNTIIIPTIGMTSEKNTADFALTFNDIDNSGGKKSEQSGDQLKAGHELTPGNGSLSSGISIITLSSVANSDPDPEAPEAGPNGNGRNVLDEPWYHTALQVSIPFFIAGVGTIGAGLVLERVKVWEVFLRVEQLFILVPSLLGLKGNLDMCLASRLCTQANLGNMDRRREMMKMIIGNLALVQIQAIVAATIVALFGATVHAVDHGILDWNSVLLMIASSVCTATSSCFILDLVMILVIMMAYRWRMNPDNLATPLAASFGDVISVSVFSIIASSLYGHVQNNSWLLYIIIAGYFLVLPAWICIVLKNKYTRNVLTSGWVPVLSALFISGMGGLILSKAIKMPGFATFQPIINGVGGNLVSVQASRISTALHQSSLMGILPPWAPIWITPWRALFKGVPYAKTARILITMGVVGELAFIFIADYIENKHSTLHVYFTLSYILVAMIQIVLLLYIAHIIIHAMWRYKIDPDNSAIPYLTAMGDLTGTLFLWGAFWFLTEFGYPYGK